MSSIPESSRFQPVWLPRKLDPIPLTTSRFHQKTHQWSAEPHNHQELCASSLATLRRSRLPIGYPAQILNAPRQLLERVPILATNIFAWMFLCNSLSPKLKLFAGVFLDSNHEALITRMARYAVIDALHTEGPYPIIVENGLSARAHVAALFEALYLGTHHVTHG